MKDERKWTPGPWGWFGNAKNNEVYLATVERGRTYVMGFERWGMRGAQPKFQPNGQGLKPASDLLMFEVGDQSVRGVDAAKADESVYRLDIRGIDCADAHLISAAPDLFDSLSDLMENPLYQVGIGGNPNMVEALMARANAALAKARGAA